MATSEDSPVAMKLKKMWLKTPVSEEQAAQAVLDPAIGKSSHRIEFETKSTFYAILCSHNTDKVHVLHST